MTTQAENILQALQLAVSHHRAGRISEAEVIYKQVLAAEPDNEHANHFLGIIAAQTEHHDLALQFIGKAMTKNPAEPSYPVNMGNVYLNMNRLDDALAAYNKALAIKPDMPEAEFNIGAILQRQGSLDEAAARYKKALGLNPGHVKALCSLGTVCQKLGRTEEARAHFTKALDLAPNNADIHNSLGTILKGQGKPDEALVHLQKAVAINPDLVEAHNSIGKIYFDHGRLTEAEASLRRVLACDPSNTTALNNLGITLKDKGSLAEALDSFRKALAIRPDHHTAHSNLLLTLNYMGAVTQEEIYAESRTWGERHTKGLLPHEPMYFNTPEKERRLRIGYVSPDFKDHSVASFFEPVLKTHDRNRVEVFCYANVRKPDAVTDRLRAAADHWISIADRHDEETARLVVRDSIDILVDLAGHTGANKLMVFARKPAPVQVAWLGYPNTTGMSTMDYRLTDAMADPAGTADALYSERLVRLKHGFLCYRADESAPGVAEPPCLKNGHVTFGSFNNLAKVTPEVVKVWARILQAVPDSRLLLKAVQLGDGEIRKKILEQFAAENIAPGRIDLYGLLPTKTEHLGLYSRVDIGLDPFPYNGTTTTCEALWMGVPVLTLAGDRHSCRVGASIMRQAGLDDLVVHAAADYVEAARSLAADRESLQEMRGSLRDILQESPLMDSSSFTQELEEAYRMMWRNWCDQGTQQS